MVVETLQGLSPRAWINRVAVGICLGLIVSWVGKLRIIQSGQYTSPGATVWRDTVVVRGPQASRRGWGKVLCPVALLGLAAYAVVIPTLVTAKRGTPIQLPPCMRASQFR